MLAKYNFVRLCVSETKRLCERLFHALHTTRLPHFTSHTTTFSSYMFSFIKWQAFKPFCVDFVCFWYNNAVSCVAHNHTTSTLYISHNTSLTTTFSSYMFSFFKWQAFKPFCVDFVSFWYNNAFWTWKVNFKICYHSTINCCFINSMITKCSETASEHFAILTPNAAIKSQ